jgi:hypothetical protein
MPTNARECWRRGKAGSVRRRRLWAHRELPRGRPSLRSRLGVAGLEFRDHTSERQSAALQHDEQMKQQVG